jgi:hypothetical protein
MLDDGSVGKNALIPDVHISYNDVNNEQLKNKYSQKIKDTGAIVLTKMNKSWALFQKKKIVFPF